MITLKVGGIIVAAFIAGAFIASPELRAYASTIANDVICNGCVGTSDLAGNAVISAKINDGGVKTADIGDGEVKTADIAVEAVTNAKLATSAVTSAKLANGAVINSKIDGFAVSNSKLSGNSVTTDKIADDTITEDDISPSFMKWVTLNDGTNGWEPNNSFTAFGIADSAVKETSVILVTVDGSNGSGVFVACGVTDLFTGTMIIACGPGVPENGSQLQYIIFNQ